MPVSVGADPVDLDHAHPAMIAKLKSLALAQGFASLWLPHIKTRPEQFPFSFNSPWDVKGIIASVHIPSGFPGTW